ncbi:MAG: DUF1905 domain-containing protein [Bacteroidetes bacterium]|nr:DUF1905 domain-containing protein [Bacteroidota bacterium]
MLSFKSIIQKFSSKGEKTGWTYVDLPQDILLKLKRKDKKEFRIKGIIDDVKFDRMATYPIGEGNYIIAINAELRKKIGKKEGAMVSLKIELDTSAALQSQELIDCLDEDKIAKKQFDSMLLSHRNYFHRYIYTAKGADTKAGRIVNVINAMYKKQDFGEMIRSLKKDK